jgi:hypothetical protein
MLDEIKLGETNPAPSQRREKHNFYLLYIFDAALVPMAFFAVLPSRGQQGLVRLKWNIEMILHEESLLLYSHDT